MSRKWILIPSFLTVAAASFVFLSGCNQQTGESGKVANPHTPSEKKASVNSTKVEEHGHKPGQHGGIMVEIGRDNYHAEAVFEKGGLLKLYTLGKDESKIVDIESQVLKAYVKEEGGTEAVEIDLAPIPRTGDKAGRTSQFVGRLPNELVGKQVAVTIPIIVVDGERFRIGFTSATEKHDPAMPAAASLDEEKVLYLTPGGAYTAADIKANGNVTASQKFKGLTANHDLKPKAGERICPITLTKANPKFTWIVGGKAYEFCCPPCIDEFVATAKSNPELLKAPGDYVKK